MEKAAEVLVSEPSAKRLALAKHLGADVAVNSRETDPAESVKEATSGKMADVVINKGGM